MVPRGLIKAENEGVARLRHEGAARRAFESGSRPGSRRNWRNVQLRWARTNWASRFVIGSDHGYRGGHQQDNQGQDYRQEVAPTAADEIAANGVLPGQDAQKQEPAGEAGKPEQARIKPQPPSPVVGAVVATSGGDAGLHGLESASLFLRCQAEEFAQNCAKSSKYSNHLATNLPHRVWQSTAKSGKPRSSTANP